VVVVLLRELSITASNAQPATSTTPTTSSGTRNGRKRGV